MRKLHLSLGLTHRSAIDGQQVRMLVVIAVCLTFLAAGCRLGGGGDERTILVDYSHDEFASFMAANFPKEVEVHPGTTLVFRQTWTGEPHTVTGGTLVDDLMSKAGPWSKFFDSFFALLSSGADLPDPEQPEGSAADFFAAVENADQEDLKQRFLSAYDGLREAGVELPDRDDPGDATFEELSTTIDEESEKIFDEPGVPWALDDNESGAFVTQNGGQPCYLKQGAPPRDADDACSKSKQQQPVFDGTASYYNSGIIPYEGPSGNTFRVDLSDDIKPGSYFFYCAVHGPGQATEVKVRPLESKVDSQEDINRRARKEIERFTEPMEKTWNDARDGRLNVDGETIDGPFSGLSVPVHASINEFVPKTITAKVGEAVTWSAMGADHTISFDVPPYFPIIRFAKSGKVSLNPRLQKPAGGAPDIPEQERPGIRKIDGGTYDGSGFFSSGLFGGEPYAEYSLRFAKPGTYKYACLLHPPMVGTVEVS